MHTYNNLIIRRVTLLKGIQKTKTNFEVFLFFISVFIFYVYARFSVCWTWKWRSFELMLESSIKVCVCEERMKLFKYNQLEWRRTEKTLSICVISFLCYLALCVRIFKETITCPCSNKSQLCVCVCNGNIFIVCCMLFGYKE